MNDLEQQLSDHFHADGDRATPEFRLDEVLSGHPTVRPAVVSSRRSWTRPALVAASVAALTIGGLVVATREPQQQSPAVANQLSAINWSTEHVTFEAARFSIDVGGQTYTASDAAVDLHSDPGDDEYQTLEVAWMENDVEMRWYVYFTSDGTDWWADEFRTYDGSSNGEWVTFTGEFFRSPLGLPFSGDIDIDATEAGITSRIRIDDMILQPFTTNDVLPAPPSVDGDPPPLPPDLPRTGVDWTPEGNAALTIAEQSIIQECMADSGWEYDLADPATLVSSFGQWNPHPVLGIGSVAAAEVNGYHRDDTPVGGAETFALTLSQAEQQDFYDALLGGDDAEVVPIILPDGTSSGGMSIGGCFGASRGAFGNLLIDQEGYRQVVSETGIDQEQVASDTERDPRIQAALSAWQACITDSTGEAADTPDELARRFAFGDELSAREIEVATADAGCQGELGLSVLWAEVFAEYQRAALGEDAELFDALARMRVEIVERANQILDDRDIELPEI